MTYVSVVEGGQVAEITMSFLPHQKLWHITPGDESRPWDTVARIRPPDGGRGCFSCHAVMDAHQTLAPAQKFFGVGCESCHGPGSLHVQRMRSGDFQETGMDDLSQWPASRILELCGQCHGSAQSAMSGTAPVTTQGTNRFQPLGLAESRCFQGSKDTLSCITCHDPHTDVSTDQKGYEAVCLSCHTAVIAHRPLPMRTEVIKLCPVNQKDGCIRCHMPTENVLDATAPIRMADHYIRVHMP